MKALKYKLMVYEGTMDFIHGGGREIEEIFIPDENIVFNKQFVFKSCEARGDIDTAMEKINIDNKTVKILKNYIEYQDKIEEERKKYFISTNK